MARIHAFGPMTFSGIQDGRSRSFGPLAVAINRMPNDPVGTTAVTFSGVVAGSEIHVYLPDGTELTGVESCTENQALTWPVYASGSPNSTVYITILKRGLRWQKFSYTSKVGAQSIPIFQSTDLGYNNPA